METGSLKILHTILSHSGTHNSLSIP